jgi:hypothetical protein
MLSPGAGKGVVVTTPLVFLVLSPVSKFNSLSNTRSYSTPTDTPPPPPWLEAMFPTVAAPPVKGMLTNATNMNKITGTVFLVIVTLLYQK